MIYPISVSGLTVAVKMGIENMRRWPLYIVFAMCILLTLSLINSWSLETELRAKLAAMAQQMHECNRQSSTCMEESLTLLEQRDSYLSKSNDLERIKTELHSNLTEQRGKVMKAEIQVNHTRVDVDLCKTELTSLKNLQVSKTAMLETLRMEKDMLTSQLADKKQKIEELEKEVQKLKSALTTKSVPVPPAPSKVTPAAQPPKLSSALKPHEPINDPVLENNAKEDIEDVNAMNDGGDFDPQLN